MKGVLTGLVATIAMLAAAGTASAQHQGGADHGGRSRGHHGSHDVNAPHHVGHGGYHTYPSVSYGLSVYAAPVYTPRVPLYVAQAYGHHYYAPPVHVHSSYGTAHYGGHSYPHGHGHSGGHR